MAEKIFDVHMVRFISELSAEQIKDDPPTLYKHEGVYFCNKTVAKETLHLMPEWEARKDDVFIVTYPKAGTTWTQEIMYLALNDGDVDKARSTHTMLRVPYVEANFKPPKMEWFTHPLNSLMLLWCLIKICFRMILLGKFTAPTPYAMVNMMTSPRLLKSHLPEHLLPRSIFTNKAKIVYVARNPKDLAVSFYHFHRWRPTLPKYDSWDRFFEDFMAGKVSYGHWYEHNLGFWKRRHEENILFLKYEDMKKDEKGAVKQICEFLGYQYSDAILDRITQHTTFGNMKKNPMTNPDHLGIHLKEVKNVSFMRKGEIGDWKNYFTDAQNKAIDAVYKEKLAGTGLEFEFQ